MLQTDVFLQVALDEEFPGTKSANELRLLPLVTNPDVVLQLEAVLEQSVAFGTSQFLKISYRVLI
jgi:hypothetical protein